MNVVALAVVRLLFDVSLKVALLAVIAKVGLVVFRVRNANARHRVWVLVLAGMMLMPLLLCVMPGVPLPQWFYPAWPTSANQESRPLPAAPLAEPLRAIKPSGGRTDTTLTDLHVPTIDVGGGKASANAVVRDGGATKVVHDADPHRVGARNVPLILLAVYLAGVGVFACRLAVGLWRVRCLLKSSQPVSLPSDQSQLVCTTLVRESTGVRVPLTVGWRRTCILLPGDWSTWDSTLLTAGLTHEQAHVERRDHWVTLVAELNRVAYWFHPVAWFLRHRLATLAEEACDDTVIERLGDRKAYAQHLLTVASRLGGRGWRLQPAGVAMARTPRIERRITSILDVSRPLARRIGTNGALLLFAAVIPLIVLAAGLRAADGQADDTTGSAVDAAARPLRGRVVMQSDGSPVASADLRLVTWNAGGTHFDTKKTRSDSEGNFSFDQVPHGKNRLIAFSGDYSSRQSLYKGEPVEMPIEGKPFELVTLKVIKCPSIAVHVASKADGKPIPGASVHLVWTDTENDASTNDQGEVTLRRMTHEVWHVKVEAKGYASQVQAVNLAGTEFVRTSFELPPGGVLYGTISDEAGKPVAKAGFSVFPANFSGDQTEYTNTDSEGRYRFAYLPLNEGLELSISKDGFSALRQLTTLADAPDHERKLDLVLKRRSNGGAVRGIVTGPDGKPIVGATISNHGKSSSDVRTATTDADGKFLLEDVFEGSVGHELIVKATGFGPQRLAFEPGTTDKPADIEVSLAAGHRIRGKVADESGKGIGGAQVYYANGNSGDGMDFGGSTTTDADGKFALDSLPNKTPFNIIADGYSEIEGKNLPLDGEDEVVVTMISEGVIRGHVIDDRTGQPISPFNVRITFSPDRKPDEPGHGLSGPRATSPQGERFASSEGNLLLRHLIREMPLQVTVIADGYQRKSMRRVVAKSDAEAKAVEFRLTPLNPTSETKIRGHIVDENSKPISGAELRLIIAPKRPFPRDRFPFNWQMIRSGQLESVEEVSQFLSATSDRDGAFSFGQVHPDEDMEITYWGEGVSQGRREHVEKLSEADRQDLKIVVTAPGIVRGTIDRAKAPGVSSIMLNVTRGGLDYYQSEVAADATSYEIKNVPPGNYQMQVNGERTRPLNGAPGEFTNKVLLRHSIEVHSGETATFDIPPAEDHPQQPKDAAEGGKKSSGNFPSPTGPAPESQNAADAKPTTHDEVQPLSGAPTEKVTITGRVTDESGQGVADAQLWLPLRFDPDEGSKYDVHATTNSDGSFSLVVPAALVDPQTATSFFTIWCYAPQHRIASTSAYQALKRQSADPISIKLLPETDTAFVVTDPMGQPVAGARVEPWHFIGVSTAYEIVPKPLRALIGAATDTKGRAALPEMGRDGFHSVRVETDTYGIQTLRLRDVDSEPAERKIDLRPTGRITGRLVSDNRDAVRDVRIGVYQEDFLGEHTAGEATTSTDSDGKFVVERFAEGPVHLIIRDDSSRPLRARLPERLDVYAGKTVNVEIPLEPAVRVHGIVRTKDDHAPVAGATVYVSYGSFQQGNNFVTDSAGQFGALVLPGQVREQLIVTPDKFSRWTEENASWQHSVEVPAGRDVVDLPPIELVQTFERGGRLIDQHEQPIANATIMAVAGNRRYSFAESRADGSFSFWLPKSPPMEKYDVQLRRSEPIEEATVVQTDPLVLKTNR